MGHIRDMSIRSHRLWALSILASALLLRLVVPAGWMPGTAADGSIRIELCTGQGVVEAWVDGDGKLHDQPAEKSANDQPCAYAGLGRAFAAPVAPLLVAAIAVPAPPILSPAPIVSIGRGLAAPPPPATGPPAHF